MRKPPPGPVVPRPSVRPPALSVTGTAAAAGRSEPVNTAIRPYVAGLCAASVTVSERMSTCACAVSPSPAVAVTVAVQSPVA